MIAGIVLATPATQNTAHFGDLEIPLMNPWVDCARKAPGSFAAFQR
jgi:hypothetical protein